MISPVSLSRLARAASGQLLGEDCAFTGIAIDSRAVSPGDLFVAIPGARVDGHDFIAEAVGAGAVAALIERPATLSGVPALLVGSVIEALGALGGLLRDDYDGVLVGVTGSSGKTTTKNMLASIFAEAGPTVATVGNRNNEIGVPLTLAAFTGDTEFAVVEMGAAKPNDIRYLVSIARPGVAVLLNAGSAHLQAYVDEAAIADTKAQILDQLDVDELAVINADQVWSADWVTRSGVGRAVTFGLSEVADYRAVAIDYRGYSGLSFELRHPHGGYRLDIQVPGTAGLYNALAAAAVATELGFSPKAITSGLARVRPAAGRGAVRRAPQGAQIIDDCYNANPESMRAALQLLAKTPGRRVFLFGAMRELGPSSGVRHAEIARYAGDCGVEVLITVGAEAAQAGEYFPGAHRHFDTAEEVLSTGLTLGADDIVLVKGSRSVGLETVVDALAAPLEDVAC